MEQIHSQQSRAKIASSKEKNDKLTQNPVLIQTNESLPTQLRDNSSKESNNGSSTIFQNKLLGPAPGLDIDFKNLGTVETDPYGKPMSPTSLIKPSKAFRSNQIQIANNESLPPNIVSGGMTLQKNGEPEKEVVDPDLQDCLRGCPKLSGLTTFEYNLDEQIRMISSAVDPTKIDENMIQRCFYHISRKKSKPNYEFGSSLHLVEIQINLPVPMLVEHLELQIGADWFNGLGNYLAFGGVTRRQTNEENGKINSLRIQSCFLDDQKQLLEVNFLGSATQQLNIQFVIDSSQLNKSVFQKHKEIISKYSDSQGKDKKNKRVLTGITDRRQRYERPAEEGDYKQQRDRVIKTGGSEVEGSEFDDLDNEVENIANKYQLKEPTDNLVKPEDIVIQLEETKIPDNVQLSPDEQEIVNLSEFFTSLIQPSSKQTLLRQMQRIVTQLRITGFNTLKVPAITNLAHLMNTSFYLRKEKVYLEDLLEIDLLLASLFISSKRNTQANEIMRNKVQSQMLSQIKLNQEKINFIKNKREELTVADRIDQEDLQRETKRLFLRCAQIELVCSESMCIKPQLNDKLLALVRMARLSKGEVVEAMSFTKQIFVADDEFTTIMTHLPSILKFSLLCLENNPFTNKEVVMIAALRNIQFILETQGCSLDSAMITILKALFNNFPDKAKIQVIQSGLKKRKERYLKGGKDPKNLICFFNDLPHCDLSKTDHGTVSAKDISLKRQMNLGIEPIGEQARVQKVLFGQNSARISNLNEDYLSRMQREGGQYESFNSLSEFVNIPPHIQFVDEPQSRKEPNSGFEKSLTSLYNSTLDSFISVLSSISSHILHSIFYEVIIPCLLEKQDGEVKQGLEIRICAIKIAEKIITICQGDLILPRELLDILITQSLPQSFKQQIEQGGLGEQYRAQMKSLWQNIKSKIFTNYTSKGLKDLVEWMVHKMSTLAQNCQIIDGKSSASEIALLEISESDMGHLSQYLEIITFISVGRRNNQEEANSLIKIKNDYCIDLYLLLNPLLFWLDFSVEREDRLQLFKQVYQTIKDVMNNLPPKKVDIDIVQIIIPILQRTADYLQNNSPSLSMIKFLEITLQDIKTGQYCQTTYPDLKPFFVDLLDILLNYVSCCLHDEIFSIFDKLFAITQGSLSESNIIKCVEVLLDKYTLKTKQQKQSISMMIKSLLEVTIPNEDLRKGKQGSNRGIIEIVFELCISKNDDLPARVAADVLLNSTKNCKVDDKVLRQNRLLQFKQPQDLHENFIEKMQFFIDCLNMLNQRHAAQFIRLILNPSFKTSLLRLLDSGETSLRLKCFDILEFSCQYFSQFCASKTLYELANTKDGERRASKDVQVMEVDFITHERLYLAQVVISCVSKAFQIKGSNDCYMQFNSLILLDYLFQHLLPVPSFENELFKSRSYQDSLELNQKRYKEAVNKNNREFVNTLNDSQIEDGSSGGEGTTRVNQQRPTPSNRVESLERARSPNYIGEFSEAIDLWNDQIDESVPELDVVDPKYIALRLKLVLNLQTKILEALYSPWSNIRSICYGLICSMLKVDVQDCVKYLPVYPVNQADSERRRAIEELRGIKGDKESKKDKPKNTFQEQDRIMLENNSFYQSL